MHSFQDRVQALPLVCEGILNLGRNLSVYLSRNDAILLQFPQLLNQGAMGNAGKRAMKLVKAFGPFQEIIKRENFPFAAYYLKYAFNGAAHGLQMFFRHNGILKDTS